MIAATGRAAMRGSRASGEAIYNASVRTPAGVRWSASGSENGTGKKRAT